MPAHRPPRTVPPPRTVAAGVAATMAGVLTLAGVGAGVAHATPGAPGIPAPAPVVFHEDFERAPDSGRRTMLTDYVGATGEHYTADPYWVDNVRANGMVLSWHNTAAAGDGTGAGNGTEDTAFNTLRQLSEAIGKINGTPAGAARTNTVISAYTQSTGTPPAGGQVMFRTVEDIALPDAQGRFLAFSMSAAATNAKDPSATGAPRNRENPQLMIYVDRGDEETPLTSTPIDPLTDPRATTVPVSALTPGAREPVRAGQFASDRSFLYEGGEFGVVVRNMTSAHLGNDGAFDDITILDVTPQLDKQFTPEHAVTGRPVRLTFTVTNTAELADKQGWAFTDALPAGLVVAAEPNLVVDGTATVVAEPGATTITVTDGDLAAGDAAVTISVDVTAAAAGSYTNGADDIVVRRGLDAPGTATVTFEDPAPVPADLVVRYVDEAGDPVAEGYTTPGAVGDPYSTAPVDVPGYELVAAPTNRAGTLTEGTTEVVYVYRRTPVPVTGDLVVRHVDEAGAPLAPTVTTTEAVGTGYATAAADVPGYELVAVHGDTAGQYREGTVEVVYVYRPVPAPAPGEVVVRYVDEDGREVAPGARLTGTVDEPYTTSPQDVPGYTLVAVPDNADGVYPDGTVEVVYVYRQDPPAPAPADLVVRWVTEDGTALADPHTATGVVGDPYTSEARSFDGYTLVAVPVNAQGELTSTTTEVVYVYRLDPPPPAPADLTVRHVDEDGNPVADPTRRDGTTGERYTTDPADVPGYELVEVPGNASGEMAPGTEVVYVYRKVRPEPPAEPREPADPVVPADPAEPAAPAEPLRQAPPPVTGTGCRSGVLPAGDEPAAPRYLARTGSAAGTLGAVALGLALTGTALVLVRRHGPGKEV